MHSDSGALLEDEAERLHKVLAKIEKEDYFSWVLEKSQTKIANGRIVALDLSWLGIRHLPERFLEELTSLRELRFDNNPRCTYAINCFAGVPQLLALKFRFCNLSTIPTHAFGDDSGIRNLLLNNNPLETLDSSSFDNLDQLQMVDLSDCQIHELGEYSFSNLRQLRSLQLQQNRLSKLENYTFGQLHELRSLNLQNNRLETLSRETFCDLLRLENLNLSHNRISQLHPSVFTPLKNLVTLSMVNNQLRSLDGLFDELTSLLNLGLNSNFIKTLNKQVFLQFGSLITLDLQYNQIHSIEPGTFEKMEKLEFLNMDDNPLDVESALHLPGIARFDYSTIIGNIDPDTLHNYIIEFSENTSFINHAIYSGKVLDKTRAFLRLIGFDLS